MKEIQPLSSKPPLAGSAGLPAPDAPEPASDWKKELLRVLLSRPSFAAAAGLAGLVALRLAVNWYEHRGVAAPVPSVRAVHPEFRPMDRTLALPADVEAIEEAKIFAHVSGYLKKLYVDEGDKVREGQLLAEIDAPDLVQAYNKAKADADYQEVTRKRYHELLAAKVVSQQEYDQIAAQAEEAEALLENAQANVEYTQIRAPFSGSIARRYKYLGDLISAATKGADEPPIFLLVNERRLRVAVNVPQSDVDQIALGRGVDIKSDALPGETFHGRISRVDDQLDEQTKTQRVLIDIDNPGGKLHAGMYASAVLHLQHKDRALTIPREAVMGPPDAPYVLTAVRGRVRQVAVRLGMGSEERVEVVQGLSAADPVLLSGGQVFSDGARVRVSEEGAPAAQASER